MARSSIVLGSAPTSLIIRNAKSLLRVLNSSGVISFQFAIGNLKSAELLLQRIIQRALQVELLKPLEQRRIVQRVDHPLILEKIEQAPLRDQFLDLGIVPERDNFGMLAQFLRAWK